MQVSQWLVHGESLLAPVSDSARLDAEVLLAFVLGRERAWLRAFGEAVPADDLAERFQRLLERRASGEPVAYLLGYREFWSLRLAVNAATLIPRPDTELLVECALRSLPEAGRLLDLGTGSGAVALAVRSARPLASVVAVDRSEAALAVARRNGGALGLDIDWRLSDWFAALMTERFNVIVGNPPYIAEDDPHLSSGDVAHEPRSALVSGVDGLDDIRRIVAAAGPHLNAGGWLWLEHGHTQGPAVRGLMLAAGFADVDTCRDLAGHERVTGGCRHG